MIHDSCIESGNFIFRQTSIKDVIVVDAKAHVDERGCFMETYQQKDFEKGGIHCKFVQDNQSSSVKGVLRGLHFQIQYPQAKLVRVVHGAVFDVAVDLRASSATYGRWEGVVLSSSNRRQLFVPRGFAHGFLVLTERAEFCYKCDELYHPGDEGGVAWDDSQIGIRWPPLEGEEEFDPTRIILSEKDRHHPQLRDSAVSLEGCIGNL